jgi:hypothetical protein
VATDAMDYNDLGTLHTLAEIAGDGSSITLSDGSRWEIVTNEHELVQAWLASQGVIVSRATANSRTYRITNQDIGQTVSATYLGS